MTSRLKRAKSPGMNSPRIPPAPEQLKVLAQGTVDLHPLPAFEAKLKRAHETQVPLIIKTGFDPTAPDLHLGHTVLIEKMRQFQEFGHRVQFLVGNYTAMIGDPTGRNAMRPPLSEAQIQENAKTYTDQCFKILDRERTEILWNADWLKHLSFKDILELAAKYNVGRMLERRDFKTRFTEGQQIALHEFLYPLMQAYDSVQLKADVELGGHDQVFNLNAGRHIMEAYGLEPQCVLTVGLLIGLDGVDKMSKSKNNHVGITDPAETMFGKIMSISDTMMADWYPLLIGQSPENLDDDPLAAKKALAETMVSRFHSPETASKVLAWWNAGRPAENLDEVTLETAPMFKLVFQAGLATSGSDARRKIAQGGVSLDDTRISDPNHEPAPGSYVLRVGKKSQIQLVIS